MKELSYRGEMGIDNSTRRLRLPKRCDFYQVRSQKVHQNKNSRTTSRDMIQSIRTRGNPGKT